MSDLFSSAGAVASASIQADAITSATEMQIEALEKQRDFVFANLDPTVINAQATAADVNQTNASLALQKETDNSLYNTRYAAEDKLLDQVNGIGTSGADKVSQLAKQEAETGVSTAAGSVSAQGKRALIDAALKDLSQGATLDNDVQAELVKAGLERSGMTTGAASAKGVGGQLLRTAVGTAAENLKNTRQTQASNLLTSAQNLETARASILDDLFPKLSALQTQNQTNTQSALTTSDTLKPTVGLSGTNIANVWLARVGATNQLAQSAADAAAKGTTGIASAWSGLAGTLGNTASKASSDTSSTYNVIKSFLS